MSERPACCPVGFTAVGLLLLQRGVDGRAKLSNFDRGGTPRSNTTGGRGVSPDVDEDDRLTLEQQVCFSLAVAAREVVSLYRPLLDPLGLTHPQYLVMVTLRRAFSRSPSAS
jgi:hypothetical protein